MRRGVPALSMEGERMKRIISLVLALTALGLGIMFAGVGGSASPVTKAQAGTLGIDDELNAEQERLISGFAAFELGKTGNDNQGSSAQPDNYSPRGSQDCTNNISSNIKVNQN